MDSLACGRVARLQRHGAHDWDVPNDYDPITERVRCPATPALADTGTLTDERINVEAAKFAHIDGFGIAFAEGAKWARDFRAPMPTREQIAQALVTALPGTFDGYETGLRAARDAVFALFDKSEATDR